MRKVSFALVVIGVALSACGGEENQPPKTPAAPAATPAATPAMTAEAPKEEAKPKETLAQLQDKTGKGMTDAMNARDAKKLAGFYTDSASLKVAGAPDSTGRDAIGTMWQKLFEAFPDYKSMPTRVWMKNDVAVVEWVMNGTHQGDLFGIKGTEKKVGFHGVNVLWFTPEGQIKEHHLYYDGATILSQIGVSPQKARPIPAMPSGPPQIFATASPDEGKNGDAMKTLSTALEAKKEADFLGAIADTVEYDDMTQTQTMKGKPDAKKFFKEMTTGFPDAKQTIQNSWSVGDFVISEGSMVGTHKGSYFGMAPTKKAVTNKQLDIMQFKDGKMIRGWAYSNGADLMMQLGKMPAPGAAKPAAAKPADAKPPVGAAKPADAKPADPKAAPKK